MKKIRKSQTRMLVCIFAVVLTIWLLCGYTIGKAEDNELVTTMEIEPAEQQTSPDICDDTNGESAPEPEKIAAPEHDGEKDEATTEPEEAAIPQMEWVYIRVNGAMLYSSTSMKASREKGTVTGIALALHYMEDHQGGAVRGIFVTGDGVLHDGLFPAQAVQVLDYQEAINEIGGNVYCCYTDNEAWPLPGAAFVPVEKATKETIEEITEEAAPAPYVVITGNMEGKLVAGTSVVLTAQVFHLDENLIAGYRWFKNVGGEWQEVPGFTGNVCTFLASKENADCEYIVEVLLH